MYREVIWNFLNKIWWRRKCLVCSQLADYKSNIIQTETIDQGLVSYYICHNCSKPMFVEKVNRESQKRQPAKNRIRLR